VDERRDPRADRTAQDLPNEDGAREEREEPLRLLGVVEIAGVHPEEDVDRLLDAVREDVRDRLDDPAVLELALKGDAGLDRDGQERDAGDVPQQERPASDPIDEEKDHRRNREHGDRCDDVHDRDVVHAPTLYEE